MGTIRCSLCESRDVVYLNALYNVPYCLQVIVAVCNDHDNLTDRIEAFRLAKEKLCIMERIYEHASRQLIEEDCFVCSGTGQMQSGPCWFCGGSGRVFGGWINQSPSST